MQLIELKRARAGKSDEDVFLVAFYGRRDPLVSSLSFFSFAFVPILYNRLLPAVKASTEAIVAGWGNRAARAEKGSR